MRETKIDQPNQDLVMNFKHVNVKLHLTCAVLALARTSYLSQNRTIFLLIFFINIFKNVYPTSTFWQ